MARIVSCIAQNLCSCFIAQALDQGGSAQRDLLGQAPGEAIAGLNLHGGTTHPQFAPESCHGLATEPHLHWASKSHRQIWRVQCSGASTALARPQPAMWAGWLRMEETKKANQQMEPKRKPKRKPRKGHQNKKPEKDTTERKPKRKAKRTPKFRTPKSKTDSLVPSPTTFKTNPRESPYLGWLHEGVFRLLEPCLMSRYGFKP